MDRTLNNVRPAASWLAIVIVAVVVCLASPMQVAAQGHEPQEASGE